MQNITKLHFQFLNVISAMVNPVVTNGWLIALVNRRNFFSVAMNVQDI